MAEWGFCERIGGFRRKEIHGRIRILSSKTAPFGEEPSPFLVEKILAFVLLVVQSCGQWA
jgi:hypothetical protein